MDGTPLLGHGFRFQWEPAQSCHVLLYPEGMIKLNRSAGEILARCDGSHDIAAIVAELEPVKLEDLLAGLSANAAPSPASRRVADDAAGMEQP